MGAELTRLVYLPPPLPYEEGGFLVGEVTSIDHYGNLVTNIPANLVARHDRIEVQVQGHTIHGLSQSYQEAEHLLAIIGSGGYMEISIRNGSAAEALSAQIGLQVRVSAGHAHSPIEQGSSPVGILYLGIAPECLAPLL